jgi:hypothetical protein
MRALLQANSAFSESAIVPYLVFPFDKRYLYYETTDELLNERRLDLWRNLSDNAFLVALPEPRRVSESRPLFATSLFDLHLHDRGSVGFPAEVCPQPAPGRGTLFDTENDEGAKANLSDQIWSIASEAFGFSGGLDGDQAKIFVRQLINTSLALGHSPAYQEEHSESLAQDWAHIPIPRERALFDELTRTGALIAKLLDPLQEPRAAVRASLGEYAPRLAVLASVEGGAVRENDLVITIPHFGGSRGGWRSRPYRENEEPPAYLGEVTGDLYLNDQVFFRNVPSDVWTFELGGYSVLKKWLGYRDARRRESRPLTLLEKEHFRSMVQRISGVLALSEQLNGLYERASANAWTVENT